MELNRLYYQYIPEGKEFPVLCRKLAAESTGWMRTIANHIRSAYKKEYILLDWNEIAENYGISILYSLDLFTIYIYFLCLSFVFSVFCFSFFIQKRFCISFSNSFLDRF